MDSASSLTSPCCLLYEKYLPPACRFQVLLRLHPAPRSKPSSSSPPTSWFARRAGETPCRDPRTRKNTAPLFSRLNETRSMRTISPSPIPTDWFFALKKLPFLRTLPSPPFFQPPPYPYETHEICILSVALSIVR